MKDEGADQVKKPRRRRWWVWAVAALVVVGGIAVRWYDTTPARYRLVGQCKIVGYPSYYYLLHLYRGNGVVTREKEDTFVFRDLEGVERWRVQVTLPAPIPGGIMAKMLIPPEYRVAVSPEGHLFSYALLDATGWMVSTWRDGGSLGSVHLMGPVDISLLFCADDGTVLLFSDTDYLVSGDRVLGHGDLGRLQNDNFLLVSEDTIFQQDLWTSTDCRYGHITTQGEDLQVTWDAPVPYDGRYGVVDARYPTFIAREDAKNAVGPMTPLCWYSQVDCWRLEAKTTMTPTPIPGSPLTVPMTNSVTVVHRGAATGWTIPLPPDTTAIVPTDDDQHVLAGHGIDTTSDPLAFLRKWPMVRRWLPGSAPPVSLALYNRAGKCEAEFSYRQLAGFRHIWNMDQLRNLQTGVLDFSPEGTHIVLLVGDDVYFLRAKPHGTVWEMVRGWLQRKGK